MGGWSISIQSPGHETEGQGNRVINDDDEMLQRKIQEAIEKLITKVTPMEDNLNELRKGPQPSPEVTNDDLRNSLGRIEAKQYLNNLKEN